MTQGPVTGAASQLRYDTLVTHVSPGVVSSRRTEIAAGLARRFAGRLIGVGAELMEPLPVASPYSGELIGEVYTQLLEQVKSDLANAAGAFSRDAAGAETQWYAFEAAPTSALIAMARAADLIVMGPADGAEGALRTADVAEVMLKSGRPVLVIPQGGPHLRGERIVVAWKDTREARRAVHDALPLLVQAKDVVIMGVCSEAQAAQVNGEVEEVASALKRRGVPARPYVVTAPDASVAHELDAEATAIDADLIVAGGYGHSRATEWLLGGATRELLQTQRRYLLLSH